MANLTFTEVTDNVSSTIIKEDNTNTDTLKISVPESTSVAIGDTITYNDKDSTTLFKGIVQTLKIENGFKQVEVWDLGAELLQRTVNQIFTNQSPEAIIQSVLSNFTSLTYVSTISSGVTINLYVAKDKRAWDIVTEMADLLLANFYVDASGNFKLEKEGDNTSTKVITTSNAVLSSAWEYDISQQVNSVTIKGDRQEIGKTELFSGTGTGTTFTLAEIPIDVKVEHPIGTEKTGYVPNSSTGDYYVERENKKVIFDTAPSSGSDNIQVQYTFEIPIKVRRRDFASISTYGQKDKVFEKNYIKSRDQARDYASYILSLYADPLLKSTWTITSNTDYEDFNSFLPNDLISVTDSLNNISGDYIIRKVERNFPGELKITVGSPEQDFTFWNKEVQTRIKQLEEKDDNSTILNEDEYIEETLTIAYSVSIDSILKKTYDADTWYWQETGGTRNDWREDGSGDIFRESSGFTEEPLIAQPRITEAGDTRITEDGNTRIIE